MTAAEATQLLADRAQELGADAKDSNGAVLALVTAHELGFYAWFCICCELGSRKEACQK